MLIHNLNCSCNFNCYKCFNYDDLIKNTPTEYYTENDILEILTKQGYLFDCLIISGGEFLLNDINDIKKLILQIKRVYDGKIIIYSNGTSPEKIYDLLKNKLVDGFHIDMKLPYHLMNVQEDKDIFKAIIGIIPSEDIINDILNSINIVIKNNSKYSQVRTVKYPILSNDYFEEIKKYIKELKDKYNSNIEYKLNEFINNESEEI